MKKFINALLIIPVLLLFITIASAQSISKKITINNDLEIVQVTSKVSGCKDCN